MSENLLVNADFEGEFKPHQGIGEVRAPAGWIPYWLEGDPPQEQSQGPLARYEMTPILASQFPTRVKSGEQAVRWFTQWKIHQGGLFQRVPVVVGQWYQFSIWLQAWCSNGDDPNSSDMEFYASLGIDPDGQTDARRRGVVWTPWNYISGVWLKIASEPVQARHVDLTVYVETWNKWKSKHADAYADAAVLELVELGEPGPAPEPCPPCPPPDDGDCDCVSEEDLRRVLGELRWGVLP